MRGAMISGYNALICSSILVAHLLSAGTAFASGSTTWTRFTDRHGSSVEVPNSLARLKDGGAEILFRSSDGKVNARFATTTENRPGFPGNDPAEDLSPAREDCDSLPPAYRAVKEKVVAFSCFRKNDVIYCVARYNGSGNAMLCIAYPAAQKSYWDPITKRMSLSIRQVERQQILPAD